jgi:hypothetical protein
VISSIAADCYPAESTGNSRPLLTAPPRANKLDSHAENIPFICLIDSVECFNIAFDLTEAREELGSILADLENGQYRTLGDAGGLMVMLAHALDHLCRAWHRRNQDASQRADQSQEAFEAMSSAVPNWEHRFKLVDGGTTHEAVAPLLRGRTRLNVLTIEKYVSAAESALCELLAGLDGGEIDYTNHDALASRFVPVLQNICLAWHLAFLTPTEVSSLAPAITEEMSYWVPPLNWNTRLISQDARPTEAS